MPSNRKKSDVVPGVAGVTIPPELLDQLVKGPMTPEQVQAPPPKTVLTKVGQIRVEVPRDRDDSYEPALIPKHERRRGAQTAVARATQCTRRQGTIGQGTDGGDEPVRHRLR